MAKIPVDLTKFDGVAEGTYIATIQEYEEKESAAGNAYLNWKIFIPDVGRSLFHMTTLKDGATFGIKGLMLAAGATFDETGFDPDDALNAQVEIDVIIEETKEYGSQNRISKLRKV